jgi:F0F1-type ATP synthase assembly protein I
MEPHPDPWPDRKKPSHSNSYLKYSSLGIQLLGAIGVAGWLGYRLDKYLSWKFPVFMLTFVLLSFGSMMYRIYISLNKE